MGRIFHNKLFFVPCLNYEVDMQMLSVIKYLLIFLGIAFHQQLTAQILVSNTDTPKFLVDSVLMGSGVVATNLMVNGNLQNADSVSPQIGYFEKDTSGFPLLRGIVLSTGNVNEVPGPANDFASNMMGGGSDPDLVTLAGVAIEDAIILEFDFIAQGDSMEFRYIFGSEEYPDYIDFGVNDVFGYFLSGPGINGPYTNNAINLATVPGTNTPVSINTINSDDNPAYYTDNQNDFYGVTSKMNGYTTILVAAANLVCDSTYHIKIALGDGGDNVYDSNVFLEAESFVTNSVEFVPVASLIGDIADTVMAENCVSAEIQVVRSALSNNVTQVFHLSYSGTADSADFVNMPDSLVFNPGADTVLFSLDPVDDGIVEPIEFVNIYGYSIDVCGDTIFDTLLLYLVDAYKLSYDLEDTARAFCLTHLPEVGIENKQGSVEPYSYAWSFGDTTELVNLPNNGIIPDTILHHVTVTDGCGHEVSDSIVLIVKEKDPQIALNPGGPLTATCTIDSQFVLGLVVDSTVGVYDWQWSGGISGDSVSLEPNQNNLDSIKYVVTMTDGCQKIAQDSIWIFSDFEVPDFTMMPDDTLLAECPSTLLQVYLQQSSGIWSAQTHEWSDQQTGDTVELGNSGVIGDSAWTYVLTTNVCGMTSLDSVFIINNFILPEIEFSNGDTLRLNCVPDSAYNEVVMLSQAVQPYSYAWSNGANSIGTYMLDRGDANDSYEFEVVVTDACGYQTTRTGRVNIKDALKIDLVQSKRAAYCFDNGEVHAYLSGDSANTNLISTWRGPGAFSTDSVFGDSWLNRTGGWYYYRVINDNCRLNDSVEVIKLEEPKAVFTPSTYEDWAPLEVFFDNESQNAATYYWDFGNGKTEVLNNKDQQRIYYKMPGYYEVRLIAEQEEGCADTSFATIYAKPTMYDEPNVFTPNEDGINDFWTMNVENGKHVELTIMNRWGNVIYTAEGKDPKWGGRTLSGAPAHEGTYYYIFTIYTPYDTEISGEGFIHLVRD